MEPGTVRVLIADDQPSFVRALEAILAGDERIEVVGSALDGREAVSLAGKLEPDVVLMDITMPVMDGLEATRRIREQCPASCVVVLTGSELRSDAVRAERAGAASYVPKTRIADELRETILAAVAR
jgi:DNA-binding NarL/FixJ family response regulator